MLQFSLHFRFNFQKIATAFGVQPKMASTFNSNPNSTLSSPTLNLPHPKIHNYENPRMLSSDLHAKWDAKLIINGGYRLSGHVSLSGSKNSALAILAATLCCSGTSKLTNVSNLSDTRMMASILYSLGAEILISNNEMVKHWPCRVCRTWIEWHCQDSRWVLRYWSSAWPVWWGCGWFARWMWYLGSANWYLYPWASSSWCCSWSEVCQYSPNNVAYSIFFLCLIGFLNKYCFLPAINYCVSMKKLWAINWWIISLAEQKLF